MNPTITFADLGLSPSVLEAVISQGYETPTPIQAEAIPVLLRGENLLGTAQTGTGKTAAFALPLLSRIDEKSDLPQILVMTPTRELAIQVSEAIRHYAGKMREFHVLPIYGGQDIAIQLRGLKRRPQVIVGTPGRVLDHIRRDSIDFTGIQAVVLDEADEMLKMGFQDDVDAILAALPSKCQRALFSATMPDAVKKIIREHIGEAKEIRIKSKTSTVEQVTQRFLLVRHDQKFEALTRILESEPYEGMIIFVRTKSEASDLSEKLEAHGYSASPLSGDLNQALRERTIGRLKDGLIDLLVATDVAARGLDVDRITHVLNYDIPYDTESYVHRIGRTGRAGRKGSAILFVTPREQRMLKSIEVATRQPITQMPLPSREQISNRRVLAFRTSVLETLRTVDLTDYVELVESLGIEEAIDPKQLAGALTFLLQKDQPLFPELKDFAPIVERSYRDQGDRGGRPGREERGGRSSRDGGEGRGERFGRDARKPRDFQDDSGPHYLETPPEEGFDRYYIGVGRDHDVRAGDIVGAIANEADLNSSKIGRVRLFSGFSTVELPKDIPSDTVSLLKSMTIRKHPSRIRLMTDEPPPERRGDRPERAVRTDRSDRPARVDRPARGDSPDRPARAERPDRVRGFGSERKPRTRSEREKSSYPPRKKPRTK